MLEETIERFVEDYLQLSSLEADKPKFVHDPLWGTIEIAPYEQCILDTPLVQRLRQIHQTGFVYQTFPSARHTRFEHTLGVMHLAGRIATTLHTRYRDVVDDTTTQRVRLAALMHDTGHSAFSHTTEEIYRWCEDMQPLLNPKGRFADKGAGEVISYLITTSKAFRAFYANLQAKFPKDLTIGIDDFAPLILSRPARASKQFEAEIISGPFDADKLDYFPRDGRSAGIDLTLDIDRLLHCLELVPCQLEYGPNAGTTTHILVVNRGGFTAIQQLLFARAALFSSVYHHHKVRACDCMVKGCFESFRETQAKFKSNDTFGGVSLHGAADYLFITDADFFAEANNHGRETSAHQAIHSLLYRRLLKRVLSISTQTIQGLTQQDAKAGYSTFYNLRSSPAALRELSAEVLKRSGAGCPKRDVWFDIPSHASFKKAGNAMINMGPRGKMPILKSLSEFIPVEKWVETYDQYYAQSFLFGPPQKDVRVKLARAAVEVLSAEPYNLKLLETAFAEDIRDQLAGSTG